MFPFLLRILEFESQTEGSSNKAVCEVELWDCSGDFKYVKYHDLTLNNKGSYVIFSKTLSFRTVFLSYRFESCWPALMKDSSGVVIVFSPDVPSHLKEIETWYSMFISAQGLQDNQCLLIAHHKPGSAAEDRRLQLGTATGGLSRAVLWVIVTNSWLMCLLSLMQLHISADCRSFTPTWRKNRRTWGELLADTLEML